MEKEVYAICAMLEGVVIASEYLDTIKNAILELVNNYNYSIKNIDVDVFQGGTVVRTMKAKIKNGEVIFKTKRGVHSAS